MSTLFMLARHRRALRMAIPLVASMVLTTGCGGGGSSTASTPSATNSSSSAPIQGIATPTAVAVVTATNAQ